MTPLQIMKDVRRHLEDFSYDEDLKGWSDEDIAREVADFDPDDDAERRAYDHAFRAEIAERGRQDLVRAHTLLKLGLTLDEGREVYGKREWDKRDVDRGLIEELQDNYEPEDPPGPARIVRGRVVR